MRIIYVGTSFSGGTCLQRMQGLKDIGHEITLVDTQPLDVQKKEKQFFFKIRRKIFGPADLAGINQDIVNLIKKNEYDISWVDKGLTVEPETLRSIKEISPSSIIVSYSPDDMMNPDNSSRQYMGCIRDYDVHITPNRFNVKELKELGAKNVYFMPRGFCRKTHRPVKVSKEEKKYIGGQVGFIGGFEEERARSIAFLAENDIPVKIWGNWPKNWAKKNRFDSVQIMGSCLWGNVLKKGICSFDINLNFLRKANRDSQTTRSVAIPACGGFMLAERSEDHMALFREGAEAEFFGCDEELLNKILYYRENNKKRETVARAGYERCINSGYSNEDRLKNVLADIFSKHFNVEKVKFSI